MINLKTRSQQAELLDAVNIPFADIQLNLQELNTINTHLGGHTISIAGIKNILKTFRADLPIVICEIGCGGGDNLKAIEKWCSRNKINVSFIGIDLKASCIEFAQRQYPSLNAKWIISDYKTIQFDNEKPDIIFSSLFCHHFKEAELVTMLQWMQLNTRKGFFINDLHRHYLAYRSIKLITGIFSKSYLVKNDAPLSVARGFKKKEWQHLIKAAGIPNCSIHWKWAFRHLIVYKRRSGV